MPPRSKPVGSAKGKTPARPKAGRAPKAFFPGVHVLARQRPDEVVEKLASMGDPAVAGSRAGTRGLVDWLMGKGEPKAWQHTAHQLGYISPVPAGPLDPLPIVHPGAIRPDASLKGARINIHLDRLHVQDYPGGGDHTVMLTFRAQNHLPTGGEPIGFSQTYRVRTGQSAGVTGYPMVVGLGVGKLGAALQFFTVNVKDSDNEAVLGLLESPAFTGGLNLLTVAQPALKPLTDLTLGFARQFATRTRNCPVQDCYLGLDFGATALGARLAVGSYLAVQVPTAGAIRWDDWAYHPGDALILNKTSREPLAFNYLAFRVERYDE
jgi:hypothetical protein